MIYRTQVMAYASSQCTKFVYALLEIPQKLVGWKNAPERCAEHFRIFTGWGGKDLAFPKFNFTRSITLHYMCRNTYANYTRKQLNKKLI